MDREPQFFFFWRGGYPSCLRIYFTWHFAPWAFDASLILHRSSLFTSAALFLLSCLCALCSTSSSHFDGDMSVSCSGELAWHPSSLQLPLGLWTRLAEVNWRAEQTAWKETVQEQLEATWNNSVHTDGPNHCYARHDYRLLKEKRKQL